MTNLSRMDSRLVPLVLLGGFGPCLAAELRPLSTDRPDTTESSAGFLEIVGIFSAETSDDIEAYFNTGMTWGITDTWQLDGGIRVGLSSASTDLTPFVGLSTKF